MIEHWGKDKGIVVSTKTGKHHSLTPIPLVNAKRQMRLLQGVEHGMKPRKQKRDDY
jgi:hypothetical protein